MSGTSPDSNEDRLRPAEAATDEIVEAEPPAAGPYSLRETTVQREKTRRHLAFGLIGMLGALVLAGTVGWMLWGDDTDRMQNFSIVFAPVTTLIGTVLGFYFSSATRD